MPVRDPSIAQAFANVAEAFRPPTGADAFGFARAGQQVMQNQSLADFYRLSEDPTAPQEAKDAAAVRAGVYTPSQSYYSVDQGNLTSRQNNTADNTRAIRQTEMQQRGETDRAMLAPVGAGATRFVPPTLAEMYKVQPTQTGVVSVGQGERATLPGGNVVEGAPKPLSETELKARIIEGLPQPEQRAVAIGNTPTQEVIGPDGKPIIKFQADSIDMRPAPKASDMTEIEKNIIARDALPPGHPDRAAFDARIAALGRGQQQSKYDQVNDEKLAELNDTVFKTAQVSYGNKGSLDRMRQLLANPNLDPGALAESGLTARKILTSLGVDMGDVSDAEALQSLGRQFALKLRDPSQGAGMPGALSDSDRQFLASMAPGLETTLEGNRKIIDYFSRVNDRNIEIEKMRNQYERERGRIDNGFRQMVTDFAQANPLFPEANAAGAPAAAPAGQPAPAPAARSWVIQNGKLVPAQ